MSDQSQDTEFLLGEFRKELLRWNAQINLVSRQETDDLLEGLFKQCLGGEEAVLLWLKKSGWESRAKNGMYYFDLGSGGGLPGIVWHLLLNNDFESVRSFLVEPREKRAWFLQRLNRISGMPVFDALHGRWGEVTVASPGESTELKNQQVIVVSLKALHLDDLVVLQGLNAAFSSHPEFFFGKSVLLARYYPPEQSFDSKLASQLKISATDELVGVGDYIYKGGGGDVLALGPSGLGLASLVVSSYVFQNPQ